MAESKWVYAFEKGNGKDKQLLGGKGANLCEMTQIGLNVPPGFVITTSCCLNYLDHPQKQLPEGLLEEVKAQICDLEQKTGRTFGGKENPLLVSVRSGSAMSMPGMMDTILNLGLNSQSLDGLIKLTGNERFSYDAYRRFIQLFGKVALGIEDHFFDSVFDTIKDKVHAKADVDLSAEDMKAVCDQFLQVIYNKTGRIFPENPYDQLEFSIKAVFNSWMGKRAIDYRHEFNITPDLANGTAVNIVAMVFGNMGNNSATGVAFTRNPANGENVLFGEYLVNAQGEDVVAGIRTPKPIAFMKQEMPEMYEQLETLRNNLESHYKEVQDFEFTIEQGRLHCLQTRNGKMNANAMVRTSVEMVAESLIDQTQAILRIKPDTLEQLLFPRLDPDHRQQSICKGMPASPGAACGKVVFDADLAEKQGHLGEKIILLREETKPEDIHGFFTAQGILTSRGGKTSHAAVVARGMGKPCIVGAEQISVDMNHRRAKVGDKTVLEGDIITINGTTGDIYLGEVAMVESEFSHELATLLSWADEISDLKVMANGDTPEDAQRAMNYGAMGIGLCRTERMFNATDRLPIVMEMILADNIEERQKSLDQLLPIQREDFMGIFKAMSPRPVTIRLLDPPIHEFLPSERQLLEEITQLRHLGNTVKGLEALNDTMNLLDHEPGDREQINSSMSNLGSSHLIDEAYHKKQQILKKVRALREVNPMLGHRGVRLGLTYPEIYKMQISAILEAAAKCMKQGVNVLPEIMVPQVCTPEELIPIRSYAEEIRQEVNTEYGVKIEYKFGTMIEVVRACLRAGKLAEIVDFFSFGTNDLTQAAFSFSREDAENKFLPMYNKVGILRDNPFEVLDVKGVGRLMDIAVEWGRKVHPGLKVGICGEQGGHPESIRFCHYIGLSYVSCSAPRVPIARLATAHAKLTESEYVFD